MDPAIAMILLAALLAAASGCPGLLGAQRADGWSIALLASAACSGLIAVLWCLSAGSRPMAATWHLPGASFSMVCDGVSCLFLLPVLIIPLLVALYGTAYWNNPATGWSQPRVRAWLGVLTAAMVVLTIASNAILFLISWEIMALAGFFLIVTDDRLTEVRSAGRIYLIATHTGSLFLLAGFALLGQALTSYDLGTLSHGFASSAHGTLAFLLLVCGFGLKAGIMPLHVWLPMAHAAAPSHVSAVLSGVVIKMGILGIVRVVMWVPDPPLWWGGVLAAIGVSSGILGVLFAIGQHDIKRLLAYHSIENIGIIMIGLGIAVVGKALGSPPLMLLGAAGAVLHVLNHGLFKSLLFLAAGTVVHAAHTRDMDVLGGLAKRMPWTAGLFLIGAIAICGLPPLNGFVSEWFIYLGACHGLVDPPAWPWAAALILALALIGGLAAACFIKVFGAVFLGHARSDVATQAHDPAAAMQIPMMILAGSCVAIGLAPFALMPLVASAATAISGLDASAPNALTQLVHMPALSVMAATLLALGTVIWFVTRRGSVARAVTWDCAYAAPSPRMQYSASSFGTGLVQVFRWALLPTAHRPNIQGLFPRVSLFTSHVPDVVLDRLLIPLYRISMIPVVWMRILQAGSIQLYLLYVMFTLAALLYWVVG